MDLSLGQTTGEEISQCSGTHIDTSAAEQHNASVPIHSLPAEIFLDILFLSIDLITLEQPLVPQLHSLARVCAHWFHSIRSNPRFWCLINSSEQEWTETMLRKTPYGAMGVRCTYWYPEQALGFLRIVREQAHRWENLTINSRLDAQCMQMLDVHAPLLKSVEIVNAQTWDHVSEAIRLSAPALDHVYLSRIHLRWDYPPLTGLKSLRLAYLKQGCPTLVQLITILRASLQLEWLALEQNEPTEQAGSTKDNIPENLRGTIQLPALKGLNLTHGMDSMSQYLIGRIEAPNCRLVWADMHCDELLRPASISRTLAKRPMQHPPSHLEIAAVYSDSIMWLDIKSKASSTGLPARWDSHSSETGGWIRISGMPYRPEKWAAVVEALELPAEGVEGSLALHIMYSPINFSAEHIAFWSSTSSIEFNLHCYPHTISALQYLSDPVVNDGGMARWPCPQLTSIMFYWYRGDLQAETTVDTLAVAILDLLEKRMAARRHKMLAEDAPNALKAISGPKMLTEKLRGKDPEEVKLSKRWQ